MSSRRQFPRPNPAAIERAVLAALRVSDGTPGLLFARIERQRGSVPASAPAALFRLLDRGLVRRRGIVWGLA